MLQAQVHHLKLNVLHASSSLSSDKSIDQSVWISGSAPHQLKQLTPHSDHQDAELTDSDELHSTAVKVRCGKAG